MNFAEIQNEVIEARFDEHQRSMVGMWINLRYAQVNAMTDWPWKYPAETAVVWTGASESQELPAEVGKVTDVFDDTNDVRLLFMSYEEFTETFRLDVDSSEATHWTLSSGGPTRNLFIAPNPGAVDLRVVSSSRPMMMENDLDEPVWPEEYHYALVLGAMATGLKVENDPTWEPLELEFNSLMAAMKDDLLPANIPSNRQYGRDMLGYEWEMQWP